MHSSLSQDTNEQQSVVAVYNYMINPDPSDPPAPSPESAAQMVGHVCPAGRIHSFGECWQWLGQVRHVRDLVEPSHQSRIEQALATAVKEGQAEVEAVFRGGAAPFLWRFVRADDTRFCVLAAPIATDPMTGLATPLTFDAAGELHARRDLAINRTELLKKIARGDDLVTILYELIGAIEQYRGRVTAAILGLRGGLLHVQAAPGLSNECIAAMHERAPSELGGAIRAAVTGEPPVADHDDSTSGLTAAMHRAGYGDVVAFPVRDLPGAVLGVLAVNRAGRCRRTVRRDTGRDGADRVDRLRTARLDPPTIAPGALRSADPIAQPHPAR